MGNKDQRTLTQDDLKTTLRKKDDKIADLEARVDAYIARTSETQARLLKTIDTFNLLKAQHVIDLTAKEHEAETLRKEVERWKAFAKVLEFERDDLKDAVEDLIRKVEMSNDLSMWPCGHMSVTKHLYELPENNFKSNPGTGFEDILDYGASIITRLRTELDHERKAHCKAIEEANFRISELEEQVAAREVRLEACIRHHPKSEKSPLNRPLQPRNPDGDIPPPKPMTDEQCFRALADNDARNKTLEIEIRILARKLEHARASASSPPFISADMTSLGPSSPPRRTSSHQPVTPGQPPIIHESPLRSSPNLVSAVPADSPIATRMSSQDHATAYRSQRSIAQLDDQINAYATQLKTFRAERNALMEVAARDLRILNGGKPPDFPQILAIEEECVRLTSQVSQLERELEHSRSSAKSREQELLREINTLKLSLRQRSPGLYPAHYAQHLDDGIDAEQNMELATPLQPTAVLAWNNPSLISLRDDPLMSLLPFSPERNSSPIIPLPRPSSPHPVKLRRLEEGLEVASAQLTEKQLALGQLKNDMEELQHLLSDELP